MRNQLPAEVESALISAGYKPGSVIGAGMEGVVVDLGDDLVAKTWHTRGGEELERLRSFYEAVGSNGLTLASPRIIRVLDVATGTRRSSGGSAGVRSAMRWVTDRTVSAMPRFGVLSRCCRHCGRQHLEAMSLLPVLEGESAFDPAVEFGSSLADLVERRARRFHAVLSSQVPDLSQVVEATASHLRACKTASPALIHGDLIPANIMVDDSGVPVGVLDFGFLSTLGDPQFDAAVAASIYDMYGSRAQANEAVLDEAIVDKFGYDQQMLHIYRAAYALVTSNCFSASGSGGHFAWCAAMLNRLDVRTALDL